jgi:hypothetical protein
LDGEGKKEVAELLSSSAEAGAARNGEAKRRPWRELAGLHGRRRRMSQGKRELREREGGLRGVQGAAPGGLLILKAASRTWLAGSPAQDTHVCCLLEEEERNFAENPLGFGRFQGKNKNCTLCNIW